MGRGEKRLWLALLGLLLAAPLYLSAYHLSLLGRFLALGLAALGIALIWGQGGMLSLGQGVFFGLGGYALAMHLKLVALKPGELPDFMEWTGLASLPWWWAPFRSGVFALGAVLAVPTLAAGVLGRLVFPKRVGGVYFALLTQALALAFSTFLISQQAYTGGFNGLTNFVSVFGLSVQSGGFQLGLYWASLLFLVGCLALARWLLARPFGRILQAIGVSENRLRFLGYDPARYKLVAFALAGGMAGIGGALFTLHAGVISPAMVGVVPSIEMVVWAAVGGRESLIGAVIGALLVNFCKDWISSLFPDLWLYAMGSLFIVVVTVLPRGLAGLSLKPAALASLLARLRRDSAKATAPAAEGRCEPTRAA